LSIGGSLGQTPEAEVGIEGPSRQQEEEAALNTLKAIASEFDVAEEKRGAGEHRRAAHIVATLITIVCV
jgi:hypothetical protein